MTTSIKPLTATEVLKRREQQAGEIVAKLDTPAKRLGFAQAVQSMINRMWDADAARHRSLHGDSND